MKKVVLIVFFFTGLLMNAQEMITGVNVSGEGTVSVVPDRVLVYFAVENQGDFVLKVKKQTEDAVNQVLDFLKKEGVPAKNIQTEYINLDKQYDYQNKTYHYSSRQAISVKIDDIADYEKILTGLMESGVNRIDRVTFQSSQMETLKSQARKKAVLNAKKKAEEYAAALGQSIGKARAISDLSNTVQPIYGAMAFKTEMEDSSGGNKSIIAPGEIEITAQVNVLFSLNY